MGLIAHLNSFFGDTWSRGDTFAEIFFSAADIEIRVNSIYYIDLSDTSLFSESLPLISFF
jgi:hypothetical protein